MRGYRIKLRIKLASLDRIKDGNEGSLYQSDVCPTLMKRIKLSQDKVITHPLRGEAVFWRDVVR